MNKLFLIASFAILAIDANKIRKIEMQTSDEPDSGMNHLFGQVTLDVRIISLKIHHNLLYISFYLLLLIHFHLLLSAS